MFDLCVAREIYLISLTTSRELSRIDFDFLLYFEFDSTCSKEITNPNVGSSDSAVCILAYDYQQNEVTNLIWHLDVRERILCWRRKTRHLAESLVSDGA